MNIKTPMQRFTGNLHLELLFYILFLSSRRNPGTYPAKQPR